MFPKRLPVLLPFLVALAFWVVFVILNIVVPRRGPLDLSSFLYANPAQPALRPGQPGSWDSYSVHAPSVFKSKDGYLMWYDGTQGTDPLKGWSIGVATSADGREWTKPVPVPVLTPGKEGDWDGVSVHDPRVLYDNSEYWMWYSGFDGSKWRVGLAKSKDGLTWEKSSKEPVLDVGEPGDWDEAGVAYSSVIFLTGTFHMWYQGLDSAGVWRIGHATSRDGMAWTKDPANPALSPGEPAMSPSAPLRINSAEEAWDGEKLLSPSVLFTGGAYHMWYTGAPKWAIGYARSEDGTTWRKKPAPVLTPGDPGAWDSGQVLTTSALMERGAPVLWYAGREGDGLSIGVATGKPRDQSP